MEINNTTRALLYLMRCALQGSKPEPVPELDYEALYKLSVFHSVVAMTSMALESGDLLTESNMSAELVKKWKDSRVKVVRKNILMDIEREHIFEFFEERGIWYLPLKGSLLKNMYPKLGMRQMADNDILFDDTFRNTLKAYMESRGYKTVDYDRGNHDVYEKLPVYNFEMHVSLFHEYVYPEWTAYYQNVKPRLQKDDGNQYGYHFSDEDFYVYLLAHGYKHYSNSGTGIRFLSDIYVFLREKQDSMNWDYVYKELHTLKIAKFEAQIRNLAKKVFGQTLEFCLAAEEKTILEYLIGSGTYGITANQVNRKLGEIQQGDGPVTVWTKFRYTWQRLFPDKDFMKLYSRFCRKHPWSIPFFRIYRLIKAVMVRRKEISWEIQAINNNEN